jgi:hypothetical protein
MMGAGGGSASAHTIAALQTQAPTPNAVKTAVATQRATQPATKAVPAGVATAAATGTPEAAGTPDASSTPTTFSKAPAPDAGSLGVTLSADEPVSVLSTFPEGPAEKAGLQAGDEILEVNAMLIHNRQELVDRIVATKPGETLTLTIRRDGAEQKIDVPVLSRRAIYCPVPEPKFTEGDAVIKQAFDDEKNWTLAGDSTAGVDKVVGSGKLSFKPKDPSKQWAGLVTLRAKAALEYIVSVDITQTGASVAGILLNLDQKAGNYQIQFLPNGSWQMSALVDGADSTGGLSFGETLLKAQPQSDPAATVTNTVKISSDGNNIFFYFNGTFACGAPLFIFADPPLDAGTVGLYAVVSADSTGKSTVVFSNFSYIAIKK